MCIRNCENCINTEACQKIKQSPLCIQDISEDILQQIIEDNKARPLKVSIQLDESTYVDNCTQLLAYVLYSKKNYIINEFLFCEQLELRTRGIDVFNNIINTKYQ